MPLPSIPAIVGQLFHEKKEAAFAQYSGWRGIGFSVTFGYGNFLCYDIKTYILLGLCVISILTYIALEIVIRRHSDRSMTPPHNDNDTSADKENVSMPLVEGVSENRNENSGVIS